MSSDLYSIESLTLNELSHYAGCPLPRNIEWALDQMRNSPVQLIAAPNRSAPKFFHDFIAPYITSHDTLADLRTAVSTRLMASLRDAPPQEVLGWNYISPLFDGVYIGDPEDLHNHRRSQKSKSFEPLYPCDGFGEKIAEVIFLDDVIERIKEESQQ